MNIYNKDWSFLWIMSHSLAFLFVMRFAFGGLDNWEFSVFGVLFAYLVGFRSIYAIDFKDDKVIVKCLLWHYKFSVNCSCKVSNWNSSYHMVFCKSSHFMVSTGHFIKSANEKYLYSIPREMRKRARIIKEEQQG